ncbi:MAG: PEP-CTERM sorting domain-containing protein [Gammaproteobacteria bacterium]|nr:PEP-CTERM sorting domain-containing protein [Gammaproteobacteria bacterium]
MIRRTFLAISVAALAGPLSAWAGPLTVDGNLADWGISTGDQGSSCTATAVSANPGVMSACTGTSYAGLLGTLGGDLVGFNLEDSNDWRNDYLVGPNYGGQNYDGEFLGVARQGNTLYIAIQTGQRPDNAFNQFAPGDISIDVKSGNTVIANAYGVEVGGGPGGAAGAGSISAGAAGSTYVLDSNGYTKGYRGSDGATSGNLIDPTGQVSANPAAGQTAGSLWKDAIWYLDPITTPNPPGRQETQLLGGTLAGLVDAFVFTRNAVGGQHAIIELAIDLALFGGDQVVGLHWRPSCGNDTLDVTFNPQQRVPEPAVLSLLAMGLVGLRSSRRRRPARTVAAQEPPPA